MNENLRPFKVTTNLPDTSKLYRDEKTNEVIQVDDWAFSSVVFYARDPKSRKLDHRNYNEWFTVVRETNIITEEKRDIWISPRYTDDGLIRGFRLQLRNPGAPQSSIQHFEAEEWMVLQNKLTPQGTFYHYFLYKKMSAAPWKQVYFRGVAPYDSNQFCINLACFFQDMGLIDESDVRYLKNLTKTPWPRPDGSLLPYQI